MLEGARFDSKGVADSRRGERERKNTRERERGGMAARLAMLLHDSVGHAW